MGTTQSYQSGKKFVRPYMQIEPAVEYIQSHFRRKVNIDEVARTVNLSAGSQISRNDQDEPSRLHHEIASQGGLSCSNSKQ